MWYFIGGKDITISKKQFEQELETLILAARSTNNAETARSYLKLALNKIYGYDNIPDYLINEYKEKIYDTADSLGISL